MWLTRLARSLMMPTSMVARSTRPSSTYSTAKISITNSTTPGPAARAATSLCYSMLSTTCPGSRLLSPVLHGSTTSHPSPSLTPRPSPFSPSFRPPTISSSRPCAGEEDHIELCFAESLGLAGTATITFSLPHASAYSTNLRHCLTFPDNAPLRAGRTHFGRRPPTGTIGASSAVAQLLVSPRERAIQHGQVF
jgi:hypothetical protein